MSLLRTNLLRGVVAGLGLGAVIFGLVPSQGAPTPAAVVLQRGERTASDIAAAPRIIAVGDVHGDVSRLRALLRGTAVIDGEDRWVAGRAVLVQVGDRLDRGPTEAEVFALLDALSKQAEVAGGAVRQLIGNHEAMNVAGDVRYVLPESLSAFGAGGTLAGRVSAFAPGSVTSRSMAMHPVTVVVGETLFVHGGWSTADAAAGRASLDAASRAWMLGEGERPARLFDAEGPVWSRRLSRDDVDCAEVAQMLDAAGVLRIVVGHTPQERGITSACGGTVWRVDVGLSAHYGGPLEALEIVGDQVRPIAPRVPLIP